MLFRIYGKKTAKKTNKVPTHQPVDVQKKDARDVVRRPCVSALNNHITHLVALHGPKLVHDLQVMGNALIPGGFVGKQIDDPWIAAGRHTRAMIFRQKTGVFDVAMMDIFENYNGSVMIERIDIYMIHHDSILYHFNNSMTASSWTLTPLVFPSYLENCQWIMFKSPSGRAQISKCRAPRYAKTLLVSSPDDGRNTHAARLVGAQK